MQRVEQLRPLSRQHHLGLNLGLKASQSLDTESQQEIAHQWQQLTAFINDELTSHFAVEEHYLVKPLLTEHADNSDVKTVSEQLLQQHKQLNKLAQISNPSVDNLRQLGQTLYDHIRFEERTVFPLAQSLLTNAQLDAILQHSDAKVT